MNPPTHSRSCFLAAGAAALILGLVSFAACGGDDNESASPTAPPPPAPGAVTVELFDFRFEPQSVSVQAGTTVRWVLRSATTTHNVVSTTGLFDSGFVFTQPGMTFERTFTASENDQTFEYRCTTHTGCCGMQGSVRVGANAPPPRPGY